MSSVRHIWITPARLPMDAFWPLNPIRIGCAGAPLMAAMTVSAACRPSGMAAWQLIRSGVFDGATASPAPTMRGSSTLVRIRR